MYLILLKMKSRFPKKQWVVAVDQAHNAGKITDDEYKSLLEDDAIKEQNKYVERLHQALALKEYLNEGEENENYGKIF